MQALARFISRGPIQGGVVAVVAALLSLVFPPVSLAGGGAVALNTLRSGHRAGGQTMLAAAVGAAVLSMLALGTPLVAAALLLVQWLPAYLLALLLREMRSLALTLLGAVGFGLLSLLVITLLAPAAEPLWRELIEQTLRPTMEAGDGGLDSEQIDAVLERTLDFLGGVLAASLTLSLALSVMLGRWWHAVLDNPGGFAREFRALRMGRVPAGLALLAGAVALGQQGPLLVGIALVVATPFLFQGLAVAHALVAERRMGVAWLVGLYVVMLLLPQLLPVVTLAGIGDNWIDMRRRLAKPGA